MARRFAKVLEKEIVAINETAFFYPSNLVNAKTTIPLRVGEERWIYTSPSGDSCINSVIEVKYLTQKTTTHLRSSAC